MKKFLFFLICVILVSILLLFLLSRFGEVPGIGDPPRATATPEPTATPELPPGASPTPVPDTDITDHIGLSDSIYGYAGKLMDGDEMTYFTYRAAFRLHLESPYEVRALYLSWYEVPCSYTIEYDGTTVRGGENGMMREYIALPEGTTQLDIKFSGESKLAELRAFSSLDVPEDVQLWEPPLEKADVLVFPCHSDDDVIFFGVLIADCVDRGLAVQLAFLTHHYDFQPRPKELLDGVWELGVHAHPIVGPFEDHYVVYLNSALNEFGMDNVVEYYVEMIRRFKPSVVVGHDRQGEYGHGAHMLSSMAVERAVELAADPEMFPGSAEVYGVWDTPKTYLHFAEENRITLDAERPLESYGGRTAFEVAWDAMAFHQSQLRYPHRPTLADEKFERYDCRIFGLVRTLLGDDTGNDIMENIPPAEEP